MMDNLEWLNNLPDMPVGYHPCGCGKYFMFGHRDQLPADFVNCTPEIHQREERHLAEERASERANRKAVNLPFGTVAWVKAHNDCVPGDACDCRPFVACWDEYFHGEGAWCSFGDERRFEEEPPFHWTEVIRIIDVGEPLA